MASKSLASERYPLARQSDILDRLTRSAFWKGKFRVRARFCSQSYRPEGGSPNGMPRFRQPRARADCAKLASSACVSRSAEGGKITRIVDEGVFRPYDAATILTRRLVSNGA